MNYRIWPGHCNDYDPKDWGEKIEATPELRAAYCKEKNLEEALALCVEHQMVVGIGSMYSAWPFAIDWGFYINDVGFCSPGHHPMHSFDAVGSLFELAELPGEIISGMMILIEQRSVTNDQQA